MDHRLREEVDSYQLADWLGLECLGKNTSINFVSSANSQTSNSLMFSKKASEVTGQRVVIQPNPTLSSIETLPQMNGSVIISKNPRLDFIRAVTLLSKKVGISTFDFQSHIHESVKLGSNVVVENGCHIGKNVILEHNVVIHSGTRIGNNTRIRANSCIGGDGFGFERDDSSIPIRFPHLGGVEIGSNVEIGALNSIARGTIESTIIEDNVKTDNLVHIAHNCCIQTGTIITACSEISGGVNVGKNAWLGPNCSLIQKISVGNNAMIGIGATVTADVVSKSITAGNPAKHFRFLAE